MTLKTTGVLQMVVVGLIALLAQIVIAPNIRVVGAVPDLVLLATIIMAIRLSQNTATVFGFVSGLLFDLISSGPFGLMTLILTLLSLIVSSFNKDNFSEHWILELGLVVLAALFGELLYGVVSVLINPDLDFFGSLLYIVLPTTLYDVIIGLVVLLVVHLLGNQRSGAAGNHSSLGRGSGRTGELARVSELGTSGSGLSRSGLQLSGSQLGSSRNLGKRNSRSGKLIRPDGKLPGGGGKFPGRPINRKLH